MTKPIETAELVPYADSSTKFAMAIAVVLDHEGGFVNDRDDPGGATNWGVSLRWLQEQGVLGDIDGDGDIDAADVRALTRPQAAALYFEKFWRPYRYDQFPAALATKILDLAVNMGTRQAHKCLQRAARAGGHPLVDDGLLGPLTRSALAAIDGSALLPAFGSEAAGVYRQIAAGRARSRKYLGGWLRRAYYLPPGWNTFSLEVAA